MTNMGKLWPIAIAAVMLVILTILSFPRSAFFDFSLYVLFGVTDFDSPETVLNDLLFLSFQRRSQPSEA